MDRQEKLFYLAVVLFLLADVRDLLATNGGASNRSRWAVVLVAALMLLVHRWLRGRIPAARWIWAGLAAGAVVSGLAVITGLPVSFGLAPGGTPVHAGIAFVLALMTLALAGATGLPAPRRIAVTGLALFSGAAAVAAPLLRGGLPSGESWTQGLNGSGLLVTAALAIVLIVPGRYYVWATRHEFGPLRSTGRAGLILVGGYLVVALASRPPLVERAGTTAFYLFATSVLYALLRRQERAHFQTPVQRQQSLSVTIIAKNEADRIGKCLESVHGWADEIVVLDSGSTDETVALARGFTDRVYETDWPGYGPQKQRALEKATGDWVLSIDADEEVTPELRHDIDAALGPEPACVAYKLPWGVTVYGKLLDFGQSARAPLRLFRREGSRFTDAQVHETVVPPEGRVGRLRGRLLHYTQRDFGHALQKVAHYGWLGAEKRFQAGKRGGGGAFGATLRALWVFFQIYVARLGFLDGQPGLVTAMLYAQVNFDKYAGLWALKREKRQSDRTGARS